jgi:hypothetical protein
LIISQPRKRTPKPNALADLIVVDGDPLKELSALSEQDARIPLIFQGGEAMKKEWGGAPARLAKCKAGERC